MSDRNMDNDPSSLKSFFGMVLFGSLFMIVGTIIVLFSANVIEVSDDGFYAPRWVVAFVGCFFIVAGVLPMLQGLKQLSGGETTFTRIANSMVSFLFLLFLAVPFNWIAFGPGERGMNNGASVSGLVTLLLDEFSTMRCVFGVFAMLINFMLVYAAGSAVRKLIFPDADKNEAV